MLTGKADMYIVRVGCFWNGDSENFNVSKA